jgi:glutamate synthase domain-containing protein 2
VLDFVKALALGADGVAVSNSAMQAIGCVAARICNTNNCPAGIATQNKDLRQRLNVEKSAGQLKNFFEAST